VGPLGSGYLEDIIAIGAGVQHCIALKNDGTLWAWGYNNDGQLGQGSTYMYSQYPVQVVGVGNIGFLTDVISISVGMNHTLALLSNGTIVGFGYNLEGQLGINTTNNENVPNELSLENAQTIFAGGDHSFAIESDGTVWSWGKNA
ncbi:Regulator of chromosome condensation, RCC1, partial [Candidatus Magnetomorum sp. HK-1]